MSVQRLDPAPDYGERELVARLRAGDEEAFTRLVRSCGGPLLAAARRFMRNEEDARDAVQEAFLKAHRSFSSFRGGSRVSTWVHRILVTSCLMKLRSRRRHPEESFDDLLPRFLDDGHAAEPCSDWDDGPAHELERKEVCALVRKLIDELPETMRTVILLRDIEELDTGETAQLLGITDNAVKIRLHRARQALRTLLDPHLRGACA
ncbi:MAG TPA: sigma-70 family RNA polymerase sigma factor [Thermoanaerobaculia bacterium]|nr:sigma-70 family RNA polymerase sigma factor [Thermoanaerobaculia bacterium]